MVPRRKKGFTLVELLIAVFILSVTISGVLLLYVTSMMSSQLAWDTTVATSHAEYILEEAQTLDSIDKIKNFNWQGWAEVQGLNTLTSEKIDVAFSDIGTNLLGIQVTVRWMSKSRQRDVVLKTKLAK
jgi:prepilin-type N-terminal cleavage/methylation domain-containing protein